MNTKLQPIPELENIPEDQLEQLHQWIEEAGYRQTLLNLEFQWGLKITYNKLYRYYQRVLQARDLEQHLEDQIALPDLLALLNAQDVPYDQAGLARIQQAAYHLAASPNSTPAKLATLQRILTYKERRADTDRRHQQNNRRLAQADERLAISKRLAAIKEAQLELQREAAEKRDKAKYCPPDGNLLPPPEKWDQIERRIQEQLGLNRPSQNSNPNSTRPKHEKAQTKPPRQT